MEAIIDEDRYRENKEELVGAEGRSVKELISIWLPGTETNEDT